jgi:membrane-associated phospholipid phosphatase
MTVQTILISISTVFLKQHSIIDIVVGFVLSLALMPLADWISNKFDKEKTCNSDKLKKESINV